MELFFPIAFSLGIFSSVHCIGMCGGISSALALSATKAHGQRIAALQMLLMNLGRVSSYTLAGALAGSLGAGALWLTGSGWGHWLLRLLGSVVLIAVGLYVAGWFPQFARADRFGAWLWRHIEPWGRKLLPVRSYGQAFAYGAVWGWLPCGLVYSALVWSAGTGSGLQGAITMASFGLGTLPTVWASGLFAHWLAQLWREPMVRRYAGLVLIVLGLATGLFGPLVAGNQHHLKVSFG